MGQSTGVLGTVRQLSHRGSGGDPIVPPCWAPTGAFFLFNGGGALPPRRAGKRQLLDEAHAPRCPWTRASRRFCPSASRPGGPSLPQPHLVTRADAVGGGLFGIHPPPPQCARRTGRRGPPRPPLAHPPPRRLGPAWTRHHPDTPVTARKYGCVARLAARQRAASGPSAAWPCRPPGALQAQPRAPASPPLPICPIAPHPVPCPRTAQEPTRRARNSPLHRIAHPSIPRFDPPCTCSARSLVRVRALLADGSPSARATCSQQASPVLLPLRSAVNGSPPAVVTLPPIPRSRSLPPSSSVVSFLRHGGRLCRYRRD